MYTCVCVCVLTHIISRFQPKTPSGARHTTLSPQHLALHRRTSRTRSPTRFYCLFNLHVICLACFFGHVLCRPFQTADHLPKPQRVDLIYCSRPFIRTYQTVWVWKEPWKNTVRCQNENVKRSCRAFSGILNHSVM